MSEILNDFSSVVGQYIRYGADRDSSSIDIPPDMYKDLLVYVFAKQTSEKELERRQDAVLDLIRKLKDTNIAVSLGFQLSQLERILSAVKIGSKVELTQILNQIVEQEGIQGVIAYLRERQERRDTPKPDIEGF